MPVGNMQAQAMQADVQAQAMSASKSFAPDINPQAYAPGMPVSGYVTDHQGGQ